MPKKSGSVTKLPSKIYGYEHVNLNDFSVTPSIRCYNNVFLFYGNGMNSDDDATTFALHPVEREFTKGVKTTFIEEPRKK